MKKRLLSSLLSLAIASNVSAVTDSSELKRLQSDIDRLQAQVANLSHAHTKRISSAKPYENKALTVHTLKGHPEEVGYHPAALMAGDYIFTYIAGMPVVTSPYLGARPAFDGSDLIVNISSINQDMRLMLQRRAIYDALGKLGYPAPGSPIVAISGSIQPMALRTNPFTGNASWDYDLGGTELDVAAALNSWVEGFFSFAYDASPPFEGGQRIANSAVRLNKSFLNVGNLDKSPFYMTAGQFYVPFGRYSSSMVSSPVTLRLARTKARALQIGYKRLGLEGVYASVYGFKSDTTNGDSGAGGVNVVYDFHRPYARGEIGASYISSLNDSGGMQLTGANAPQFAGFGAAQANEAVSKTPAVDIHANVNIDAWAFIAEWVSATRQFRNADLSFNQVGAKPQAFNGEVAYTFKVGNKPASVGAGYGYTKQALALGLPKHRYDAVFNISLWKDTVQSLEYRHDVDYNTGNVGTGINATQNINGTGRTADTVSAEFDLYF